MRMRIDGEMPQFIRGDKIGLVVGGVGGEWHPNYRTFTGVGVWAEEVTYKGRAPRRIVWCGRYGYMRYLTRGW